MYILCANSVEPYQMPPFGASDLVLHCMPKRTLGLNGLKIDKMVTKGWTEKSIPRVAVWHHKACILTTSNWLDNLHQCE